MYISVDIMPVAEYIHKHEGCPQDNVALVVFVDGDNDAQFVFKTVEQIQEPQKLGSLPVIVINW